MHKGGALASLPRDRQTRRRKRQDSSLTTLTHPSKGRLVAPKLLVGRGGRARDLEAGLQQHPLPPGPSSAPLPPFLSCLAIHSWH